MTIEFVVLLILSMFIAGGIIDGPSKAFKDSSLYLGARLESHIETGGEFVKKSESTVSMEWIK